MQARDISGGVRYEIVEICCFGLSNCEGERVTFGVEDVRGVRLWREHYVGREREEVLESQGKRVFESWKHRLQEVSGGVREVIEENAFTGYSAT